MNPLTEDPLASQAIEWMVLLRSGEATQEDAAAFEHWRQADARHESTCRRIEKVLSGIPAYQTHSIAARKALMSRRRVVKGLLGMGGVAMLGGLTEYRLGLLEGFNADYLASVGHRETFVLDDGTRLLLNARSALNQTSDGVALIRGEALVRRSSNSRFAVQTRQGVLQTNNAATLSIKQSADFSRIALLSGEALWQPLGGGPIRLPACSVTLLENAGITLQPELSAEAETAWIDGVLQVADRPLHEVVSALEDYRPGFIQLDPTIANFKISGVFPLDNTDAALSAIATALPVRITMTTAYWTRIQSV